MTTFLVTLLITTLYSGLFLFTGAFIIEKLSLLNKNKFHKLFLLGSGFFIGYSLFLSFWCILDYVFQSAKFGLFLSTLGAIITSFLFLLEKENFITINRKQTVLIFLLFLILISFGTFRALTPMPNYFVTNPELVNPFLGFGGVGHSFRAGNISEHIVTNDNIPLINQHSGQSILATIPMFLANQSAQLSLVLWLNIFIGFFIVTIYGFTRGFFSSPFYSLIPVLVVFLGNTVLSPFYASITDTESTLLLSINFDSIFGIATFFISLIVMYLTITKEISFKAFTSIFLLFGFVWNITSGQMIILLILSIIVTFLMFRKKKRLPKTLSLPIIGFTIAAVIGSLTIGGMLSPIKSETTLPGLMNLKIENEPVISFRFPRTGEGSAQNLNQFKNLYLTITNSEVNSTADVQAEKITTDSNLKSEIKNNSLHFKIAKLVRSVQLVFFPIVGIFLAVYLLLKLKVPTHLSGLFRFILINTSVLFVTGWIASSIFKLYGYYWELSKFLYIGSFLGMLVLGIALSLILINTKKRYLKILIFGTLVFISIGPTIEYTISKPLNNIFTSPVLTYTLPDLITEDQAKLEPLSVSERFNLLIDTRSIYGQDYQ